MGGPSPFCGVPGSGLDELGAQVPAVMVTGPRATGKTTAAARRAVDEDPRPNRFLLTGSVRAEHERVAMYPMSVRERSGDAGAKAFLDQLADGDALVVAPDTPDLRGYVELALESGFPTAALRLSGRARRLWLQSYLQDLLTHDVEVLERPATKRRDSARLRRYFDAYALNSAGVADHKTIFDAAGVTKVTAVEYEDLLARLLVVDQMPAWTSNGPKRLVKTPKRYVVDAALIAAALRLDAQGVLADGDVLGRILDTFVVAQLRPETVVAHSEPRLHHLRTEAGRHEVDVVVQLGGERVIAIEIKASAAPTAADAKHLRWLRAELGDRVVATVILHTGPRVYELPDGVVAAPISTLWGARDVWVPRQRVLSAMTQADAALLQELGDALPATIDEL